jgi:hypothetical protein
MSCCLLLLLLLLLLLIVLLKEKLLFLQMLDALEVVLQALITRRRPRSVLDSW